MDALTMVERIAGTTRSSARDDLVFINPDRDHHVVDDAMEQTVWDLLDVPIAVGRVVAHLQHTRQGDPVEIKNEILELLERWAAEGLINVVERR